jgi:RNA recognition motif-containing protein
MGSIGNHVSKSAPLQIHTVPKSVPSLFGNDSLLSNSSSSPNYVEDFLKDENDMNMFSFIQDFELDGQLSHRSEYDGQLTGRSDRSSNYDNEDDLLFEPKSFEEGKMLGSLEDLLIGEEEHYARSLPNGSDLKKMTENGDFVEHPLGEHPSRTLFVRNISSVVEDDELKQIFEAHGNIRNMYTQCKHRGFVMISYYDIRHAKSAMKGLQGKIIKKRKIDIHYSIPKDNPSEKDMNQGTLVVFNLDPSITNDDLKVIFCKYGEVKEIRETPNKKHHKFVEFYDVREADKAMKTLNKMEIKGKKIKIEPSRPGGARRSSFVSELGSPTTPDSYMDQVEEKKSVLSKSIDEGTERIRSRNRVNSVEDRRKFSLDNDKVKQGDDKRCTLMIKNIPNKYTQKMLLQTIDTKFKGTYDFMYLPIDFKNRCNVGYAFINFISPLTIIPFSVEYNGKKWEKFNSEKVCDLTYGRIQGKSGLIEHFQNSSLMNEEQTCRPIIFHSDGPHVGKEQPFPVGPGVKYLNYKKKPTKKKL